MRAHRLIPAVLLATLGALAFTATPAFALKGYLPGTPASFGASGSGNGELKEPTSVAVNDSLVEATAGDVYVLDKGNDRVEYFDSAGAYVGQFDGSGADLAVEGKAAPTGKFSEPEGIAVDNSGKTKLQDESAGDVYVADVGHDVIDKFSATGKYEGQLTGTCEKAEAAPSCAGSKFVAFSELHGVAVDPEGNVWVYENESAREGEVAEFSDTGGFLKAFDTKRGANPGIAVDAGDNVYPIFGSHKAGKFEAGTEVAEFGSNVNALTVDPPTGGLLLDTGTGIDRFGPVVNEVLLHEEEAKPLETFPSEGLVESHGVAVNNAGTAYVTQSGADNVEIFDYVPLPPLLEGVSVSDVTSSGVTLAAKVNPEAEPTTYTFEYAPVGGTFTPVAEPEGRGRVAAGTTLIPISVRMRQGLEPGRAYEFHVVVSSPVGTVTSNPVSFTTQTSTGGFQLPDDRQWEMVSPPQKDGARVEALNAGEVQAAEDGDAIAYFTTGPIAGESSPEANDEKRPPVLSTRGPDGWGSRDITTGNASTTGATLGGGGEYRLFSADLSLSLVEQFAFVNEPPLLAPDASERTDYLRADAPVAPGPAEAADYAQARSNGEASKADAEAAKSNGETAKAQEDIFGEPGYVPLLTSADTVPGAKFGTSCEPKCTSRYEANNIEGATPDLSHVVLRSRAGLTPQEGTTPAAAARGGEGSLYEWSQGSLRLVSVLPEGKQAGVPVPKTGYEESEDAPDGPALGGPSAPGIGPADVRHAISNDGSRVVWTERYTRSGENQSALYMRDVSTGETVELDTAQGVTEPTKHEAVFQTASSNGSRVYFTDTQKLVEHASAEPGKPDLYVCEMEEVAGKLVCSLQDLTIPASGHAEVQGDFVGENSGVVLGASEEQGSESEGGAYVYFVAKEELTTEPNPEGHTPAKEADNLYVDHYDPSTKAWKLAFIATLSDEDRRDWIGDQEGEAQGDLSPVTARVSPNGRFLAFMSDRSLTGYDNTDANSGAADEEVFEYDAASGRLACASCDPSGAQPVGMLDQGFTLVDPRGILEGHSLAGSVPGWDELTLRSVYQPRYLSDNGRLFFDSPVSLVRLDSNGVEDVYEYEPKGVGPKEAECGPSVDSGSEVFKPERAFEVEGQKDEEPAGCVGLISSGESNEESAFIDASANGNDVFFITTSQLVKADFDHSYDLYDAHVCSAETAPCFPEEAAVPPACTSGASCKAAPTPQPTIFGAPSSQTFSGAGNVAPVAGKPAVKKKLRAEQLAKALKQCRKDRSKSKRESCERAAKKKYSAATKKTKAKKK